VFLSDFVCFSLFVGVCQCLFVLGCVFCAYVVTLSFCQSVTCAHVKLTQSPGSKTLQCFKRTVVQLFKTSHHFTHEILCVFVCVCLCLFVFVCVCLCLFVFVCVQAFSFHYRNGGSRIHPHSDSLQSVPRKFTSDNLLTLVKKGFIPDLP